MSTKAKIKELEAKLKNILDQARIRSALFSDIIMAISDIFGYSIHIMERDENVTDWPSSAITFYTTVKDPTLDRQIRECFIFIPKLSRDNLDTVRYEVAHELGHIVFHRNGAFSKISQKDKELTVFTDKHTEQNEVEADAFAAVILSLRGKIIGREKRNIEYIIGMLKRKYTGHEMELIRNLLNRCADDS